MKIFEKGLDHLLATVENTTRFFFEGAEEIGSSDISCCVRAILREYYHDIEEATNPECVAVRNAVQNTLTAVLRN